MKNDAELLATELQSLAASTGAHIIAASLDTEQVASPTVALSHAELLSLVAAIRPPIIYAFTTSLDTDAEIAAALDKVGGERGDPMFDEVTQAGRGLAAHQGQPARIIVEVMAGGVLHICYAAASSIVDFDDKVETIASRAAEEGQVRLHEAKRAASAHVRGLAKLLMADPAFEAGRPSFAKRRFLAGEIFPNENEMTLDEATEVAENLRWLATSRG